MPIKAARSCATSAARRLSWPPCPCTAMGSLHPVRQLGACGRAREMIVEIDAEHAVPDLPVLRCLSVPWSLRSSCLPSSRSALLGIAYASERPSLMRCGLGHDLDGNKAGIGRIGQLHPARPVMPTAPSRPPAGISSRSAPSWSDGRRRAAAGRAIVDHDDRRLFGQRGEPAERAELLFAAVRVAITTVTRVGELIAARAGIRVAWQGGCGAVRRRWCGSARSSSSRTWRGLRARVVR